LLFGARDYQKLGDLLQRIAKSPQEELWLEAASFVETEERSLPPPMVDAELKMVLFAAAMLTSPNFPIPSKELFVARYYANECHFAAGEIAAAIQSQDVERALDVYSYGKDAWNSYILVVNRSISPKMGEKFELIA
jgi:hypothetical protein